jgi:hypothetical protein
MRTLAVIVFIAGTAAIAIFLARKPTVAAGQVMEEEFLALLRPQGVTGVACDREIPIGRTGAAFACTATLKDGATQLLDCSMDRDGKLLATPAASPRPAATRRPAADPSPAADPAPAADPSPAADPTAADPGPAADPVPAADPAPAADPSPATDPPAADPSPGGIRASGDPWGN